MPMTYSFYNWKCVSFDPFIYFAHPLPRDTAIPLLGIYAKEKKTLPHKDICTPMFILTLFTIART